MINNQNISLSQRIIERRKAELLDKFILDISSNLGFGDAVDEVYALCKAYKLIEQSKTVRKPTIYEACYCDEMMQTCPYCLKEN